MRIIEVLLLAGLFMTAVGCFIWLLLAIFTAMMGCEETNNMAKKDTKLEEIRVRIPKEYKSILDEYCDTFGTTIQATLFAAISCHIRRICGTPSRTREVVVKLNNFTPNYSPPSQNSEKSSLKRLLLLRKKEAKPIPEDFNPPREISEAHGLDHAKAVTAFMDWALSGKVMQIGKPLIGTHVAVGWVEVRGCEETTSSRNESNLGWISTCRTSSPRWMSQR